MRKISEYLVLFLHFFYLPLVCWELPVSYRLANKFQEDNEWRHSLHPMFLAKTCIFIQKLLHRVNELLFFLHAYLKR